MQDLINIFLNAPSREEAQRVATKRHFVVCFDALDGRICSRDSFGETVTDEHGNPESIATAAFPRTDEPS